MAKEKWEQQLKEFWKKAGTELKRTTDDLRHEAQRIVTQVSDPANQEKMKQGLREFGTWTKQTVEDAAMLFEQAIDRAGNKVESWKGGTSDTTAAAPAPAAPKTASRAKPKSKAKATASKSTAKPKAKPAAKKKASAKPKAPKK